MYELSTDSILKSSSSCDQLNFIPLFHFFSLTHVYFSLPLILLLLQCTICILSAHSLFSTTQPNLIPPFYTHYSLYNTTQHNTTHCFMVSPPNINTPQHTYLAGCV